MATTLTRGLVGPNVYLSQSIYHTHPPADILPRYLRYKVTYYRLRRLVLMGDCPMKRIELT